ETEITAPADGTVSAVDVAVGEAVQGGQVLLEWA
ncbi:MAG: biotin/lipoyl-binding protein, partial [Austwickia sp.]|nr:biotin/lipoyl-binding protein [Austwickia sp.]